MKYEGAPTRPSTARHVTHSALNRTSVQAESAPQRKRPETDSVNLSVRQTQLTRSLAFFHALVPLIMPCMYLISRALARSIDPLT